MGRDVLSRLVWGSRLSLLEFFGSLVISLSIGCFVGLLSGYYDGKWFSYVLDRITDVFISIPLLIFVIFFPIELGFPKWIITVGIATWGITAKIAKSQAITIKERAYIEAARAAGAGNRYIIRNYILPEAFHVIASSIIYTAALIISLQSALDYFGFRRSLWSLTDPAKTPNVITWGSTMGYSTTAFFAGGSWWIVMPAAICMVLLDLSIVFVADAMAYALNPQLDMYAGTRISGIKRLYQKLKRHKKMVCAVLGITVLVIVLTIIPTPRVRVRNEARNDLEQWLPCWGTLTDGQSWQWNPTTLPSNLRIVVNISSTEYVKVLITNPEGNVYNKLWNMHDCTINASGPYLHVNIENPTLSGSGASVVVTGDIRIYHDYEVPVSYTEWLPWWMP